MQKSTKGNHDIWAYQSPPPLLELPSIIPETQMRFQNGLCLVCTLLHATTTSKSTLTRTILPIATTTKGGPATLSATAKLILLPIASGGVARGRLLVRRGDDFGGQCQITAEVLDALGREVDVMVLPAECHLDEAARFETLDQVQNLEVRTSLDVRVGGGDGILLHDEDALAEEIGEDCDTVGLGDEHYTRIVFRMLKHEKRGNDAERGVR